MSDCIITVIPGAPTREPGIHYRAPKSRLDSGFAVSQRPGMTAWLDYRNRLFAGDGRAIIVGPGQHHRAGFIGLELELDIRVCRDRGLEIGGEHLLAGDRADELVEDLTRHDGARRVAAVSGFHH